MIRLIGNGAQYLAKSMTSGLSFLCLMALGEDEDAAGPVACPNVNSGGGGVIFASATADPSSTVGRSKSGLIVSNYGFGGGGVTSFLDFFWRSTWLAVCHSPILAALLL